MALEKRQGIYGEYWGNDFNSSNHLTNDQMKINATYIYGYLSNAGWTLNAISAVLGNMQSESSINPGRWESERVGGEPERHGYGLVQWTPYTKYTNWITNNNLGDPSTMDNNLLRIIYEVENNIQWIETSTYNYSFEAFTKSQDAPYTLAIAFIANYERPADPNQPQRGTQAEFWYEYLSGVTPPKPGPIPGERKNSKKWFFSKIKKIRINV